MISLPIGSMYGIYANIYHPYNINILAYIPAPWILWVNAHGQVVAGPRWSPPLVH